MSSTTVAVLGAGSWGTALAALLQHNGAVTRLWGRDAAELAAITASHRNQRYLPDVDLPAGLLCEPDLAAALHGVDFALIAVPSHAFGEVLGEIAPLLPEGAGCAWATKGFEPGTGRFLHELVAARLPGTPAAVVTGPSFAREVAAGMPTAVTVHSAADAFAHRVAESLLAGDWSHPYTREAAAFPVKSLRGAKYWAPVGRVDNVYGDRNLFCSCLPVSELA